jgi:hypothetical protein
MKLKHLVRSPLGICLFCLAFARVSAAPPPHDNFTNRIQLSGEVVVTTGNNVDATRETGEPFHWSSTGGASVWWTWTAPNSGPAIITTFGSDFDTILAVYTGNSLASLALVANNDDSNSLQSAVEFTAAAGTTYQIAVDGYSGATGNIQLNVTNLTTTAVPLTPWGAAWKYLDNGSDPGTAWRAPAFDDSSWSNGVAQLGYGDGDEATIVRSGPAGSFYATTYFRTAFFVEDPSLAQSLDLSLLFDDGGIVYLNGQEVLRTRTMPPDPITYQTYVAVSQENELASGSVPVGLLVPGTNVLAVEIHQNTPNSTDVSFDLQLIGTFEIATNRPPIVSITNPISGTIFGTPANITIGVSAIDRETTVTNVEFYANTTRLGQDTTAPYSFPWNSVPAGSYTLRAVAVDDTGLVATSAPVSITVSANTAAPTVFAKTPAPGTVTNLTQITVTFSKPVTGVDAADFLVNGGPATGVSGSGSNYTFTFPQPGYGTVSITWAVGHGINDGFIPANAFNAGGAGAAWQYQLNDAVPPNIAAINPTPGSTVAALNSIQVTFTEPVTGVNASDLLINSGPASGMSGSGAGPYSFTFAQPAAGTVQVGWTGGHGIQDLSGNVFSPMSWTYVLDTNASGIVISEIMYHPSTENPRHEFIELHNKGAASVNLSGWRLRRGVEFTLPTNTVIHAAGYLVIAADQQGFMNRYPGVTNVVGSWLVVNVTNIAGTALTNYPNKLSNTRNRIDLEDPTGRQVNTVTYADEGDWAIRQRGLNDGGYRGWTWRKEHDGLGKSLELINVAMPNEYGQNWAASLNNDGTPGRGNSVASNNIAPIILEVQPFPIIPQSSEPVAISARILDETSSGMSIALHWRVDSTTPPAFSVTNMFDDGLHGDGSAGDGIYGAILPAMANNTIVEFYVRALDAQSRERTWPGPAVDAEDLGAGVLGQVANALYQVDDSAYANAEPLYKIVMRASEYTELGNLFSGSPNSDATMDCTFISIDGTETLLRYRCGTRNRGHGSRSGNPHNYRLDFPSDDDWKGVTRLSLNARSVHAQHFGSVLLQKSGAVGGNSRGVRLRVNNNAGPGGTPTYGVYAANEPVDDEWASNHFPNDGGGNVYRVIRDINPPDFDYRTSAAYPGLFGPEDPRSYQNTYFKQSNSEQNEWMDLIGMLRVMGPNGTTPFTSANIRQVVNVEQWLTHLAVMALVNNRESGLNTGFNDDYYLYRGVHDPQFILVYHDLDTIIGEGDTTGSTTASVFGATASNGSGAAMNRFLHDPAVEPLYYATLQRLIDTTFAPENFNPLIDQTLGAYVPANVISRMKTWNANRVAYVRGVIAGLVPPQADVATVVGEPRSPTPSTSVTLTVRGANVTSYSYRLNNGPWSAELPVGTAISLTGLANGSTNTVFVIGRNASGVWQDTNSSTVSRTWVVNTAWPRVRLNEVLARNDGAVNHQGTFPDLIELFNEGGSPIDLSGMRLTDDANDTNKFTFPPGTALPANGYLVLYANNADGTLGLHLGFSLDQNGEGVFLYDRAANGSALLDSVVFGWQLPNLSIGRVNGGTWELTQPAFGAANLAQASADPAGIKINEWLTAPQSPFLDDFIELYNPATQPVQLGGFYLTDNAIGAPTQHRIPALSFIGGKDFLSLTADGSSGGTHVSFRLDSDQGEIALLNANLDAIDCVYYGPQRNGMSRGRCPDAGSNIVALVTPTPGAPNLCPVLPPAPVTVPLVAYDHSWNYDETSDYTGVNWMASSFDDSGWLPGQGVLARRGSGNISQPIRATLTLGRITYYFRTTFTAPSNANFSALQVTHFFDDGAVVYLNGQELYRYNMPGGVVNYSTFSSSGVSGAPQELGPFPVPLTNLVAGSNVLAVEVHQSDAGSSDVYMGLKVDAVIVTNTPSAAGLIVNEILADNASLEEPDGSTPDWVELYNPSQSAADLSEMSFSDSTLNPRRWVFAPGSIIPAQGFLRVRFDSGLPVSATNTGFGLSRTGDSLYLFDSAARGGGVLDFVAFGLQVPDLSIGRVPNGGSNWVLTLPTIGSANLAAPLGDPTLLRINEWMADPGPGEDDWFEVYNPDPQPVAIGRFYFTDVLNDTTRYQPVPPLSFIGSGSNSWQRFWADGNIDAGADHVEFSLRASGEAVGIARTNGALIDGISFANQQEGISEGRLPDGAAAIVRFPGTVSPGDPNYFLLANIVINEVLTHTDLPLEDAIELRNLSGATVNIGGWFLSDSKSNLRKFMVPLGTTIPPFGFKVFYEYQFNDPDTGAPFSFSSSKGDNAYLSLANTNGQMTGYRALAKFGPAENGVSFGRYVNSVGDIQYVPMRALSLGTSVTAQSPTNLITTFRTGQGATNPYPKVGPIVISEIMYYPAPLGTNDNTRDEFVELKNTTNVAVALYDVNFPTNRWRLRGGVDFDFPTGISIPATGTLLIVGFDPSTNAVALNAFRSAHGITNPLTILGPWEGKLANSSEDIELYKPDPPNRPTDADPGYVPFILVEHVDYSDNLPWPTNASATGLSLQRVSNSGYANDPTNWFAALPTVNPPSSGGDSDGDGIPDWWMTLHFGHPTGQAGDNSLAGQDPDHDGMTNLQEYLAGTNPRDANSRLALAISLTPVNAARLQFQAVSNVSYAIEYRGSLSTGSWSPLTTIAAAPNNRTVTLTNAVPAVPRFYRVRTP